MDRDTKKGLQSRARYDWETHTATRGRNARQVGDLPEPKLPATGTERIAALLRESRLRSRRLDLERRRHDD